MADDGCLLNVYRLCFARYHYAPKMYIENFILIAQDGPPGIVSLLLLVVIIFWLEMRR